MYRPKIGERFLHRMTGRVVLVRLIAELDFNGEEIVVYERENYDQKIKAMCIICFMDGRFSKIEEKK